jgi:hypothetical protein
LKENYYIKYIKIIDKGEKNKMKEVKEGKSMIKELKSVSVFDISVRVSIISLILTFLAGILYYIVGYSTVYQISTYIISLNPETATFVTSIASSITQMGAIYLILVWPVMSFVGSFVVTALGVMLYNLLASKIGGIKVELV